MSLGDEFCFYKFLNGGNFILGILLVAIFLNVNIVSGSSVAEYSDLAIHHHNLGDYETAIYYYDKVLRINPNNEWALGNKGGALIGLDKYSEAI
jgi:tetratricopeptide (TPR) repeat protein